MADFLDVCRFTPTAGGTTDWTYSAAVTGYNSPALAGVTNGSTYKYRAESSDLTQWEVGEGTYNTGTGVLARTTVLYNSSGTGFASGQSGAGTKISFSTAPQVAIVALTNDVFSPGKTRGYIFGLTLSTAGSSATFSVAAGVAVDSNNGELMTLGSSISKTTSAWAVGSGNGGLDTGAIATSTWYHVHQIKRVDTGVVDVLISLSASSPTMPANYTKSRRIGAVRTNGSSQWVLFTQTGDEFIWAVSSGDVNTTVGTGNTSFTLTVPPSTIAKFRAFTTHASSASGLLITSPQETSPVWNSPVGSVSIIMPASTNNAAGQFAIQTNSSSQINALAPFATTTIQISTYGWTDRRGRD
jgi:hypothetical protein